MTPPSRRRWRGLASAPPLAAWRRSAWRRRAPPSHAVSTPRGAPSPAPAPAAPAATATSSSSAWNAAIVKAAREAVEKGVAQFLAL